MAIVCASQFVSKCLHAKYGTATDSKSRTFQNKKIADFKNQLAAHHGLRSQNFVDLLQMRTNVKAKSKQAKKGSASAGRRPCAVVICGKGINIVFVGAEMAPWSKTGGLGDVLGGLPPAMAVISLHFFDGQVNSLVF